MVISPTAKGWQEFHTRYPLEKVCLEEAGHRFSQANMTPLLQNPMLQWFGEIRTNQPSFKWVLSRTIKLEPQTDPYVKMLFQHLCCPAQIQEIWPRMLQEYSNGWQKVQEATSSSLSRIHFGHYMAGTFNPDILIFNVTWWIYH